jgi:hypothetical protein
MRLLAVAVICCLSSVNLQAAEPTMPRFYLDYAVVQDSLKNGHGYLKELLGFAKTHRQQADFLAEFWWARAKKECIGTFKEIANRYGPQINQSTSAIEKTKLEKALQAEADQCVYGVIYDHWDEINKMILEKVQRAKQENAHQR